MADRHSKPTARFDSQELAKLTAARAASEGGAEGAVDQLESDAEIVIDDPNEWDDDPALAGGSQPAALPTTSRTATLPDPLTTTLLAEVTRHSRTMEMDPQALEDARRAAAEPDASGKPPRR